MCCARRSAGRAFGCPFGSMPGSFCPTTCIACGPWPSPRQAPTARRCRLPRSLARDQNRFAKSLPKGEARSPVMTRRGEHGIWQRRYWEHTIRDERDFAAHMEDTHFSLAPTLPSPVILGSSPGRGGLGRGSTRWTGRTHRSVGVSRLASIPPDGQAAAPSRKRPASGGEIRTGEHRAKS